DYIRLGGYEAEIRSVDDILAKGGEYLNPRRGTAAPFSNPWPPLAQLRRAARNGAG
ncbi:MAG: 6-hydroxynicotinate reductase, partial [Mesorhizobium sp.]